MGTEKAWKRQRSRGRGVAACCFEHRHRFLRHPLLGLLTLLAVAIPSAIPSAVAVSLPPAPTAAAHPVAPASRAVRHAADRLTGSASLAAVVETAAALGGVHDLATPGPAPTAPLPVLPDALVAPVMTLLRAVDAAGHLARSALPADSTLLAAAEGEARARLDVATAHPAAAERALAAPAPARLMGIVDRSRLAAAAHVLAHAADDTLAELRGYGRGVGAGVAGAACDIADVPGVLCVAGTAANLHHSDYGLLIDLGGDDRYENAAGGADPGTGVLGPGNGLAAAIAIDLGGADVYETRLPTRSGARAAQGAGYLGGVGMLVDAGGDDRYATVLEQARRPGFNDLAHTLAHGQGFGSAGAGLLFDLGGNDAYLLANRAPATETRHDARGQGYALLGGLGMLVDQGSGSDSYVAQSRPVPAEANGKLYPGNALVYGQAVSGFGGIAVFGDGGGRDEMTVEAVTEPSDPTDAREPRRASASATGQGAAIAGGLSVSLSGIGTTTRSIRSIAEAPWLGSMTSTGFGASVLGGYGGLHDRGGNDSYVAEARAHAVKRTVVDDGCDCETVVALATTGYVSALTHGSALGGVAVLDDSSGDDAYRTSASASALADARHERTAAPPVGEDGAVVPAARAVAKTLYATVWAQGAASLGGQGLLHDGGGDDAYDTVTGTDAGATAWARAEDAEVDAVATTGNATSEAQGSGAAGGFGHLEDLGGTDAYSTRNTSEVHTQPDGEATPGTAVSSVQGSVGIGGSALFADLDGGARDHFSASPEDRACAGTRGGQAWIDCGQGAGAGGNA